MITLDSTYKWRKKGEQVNRRTRLEPARMAQEPDSDRRERLYRLRDESEWIRIEVPDLRIVDRTLWRAVRLELARRQRDPSASFPAGPASQEASAVGPDQMWRMRRQLYDLG